MQLFKLHIKNFRKIEDMVITFPPGLCVLVGENNSGKTAIIDALRLLLLSSREFDTLRLNEDDFRVGTNYAPIEMFKMKGRELVALAIAIVANYDDREAFPRSPFFAVRHRAIVLLEGAISFVELFLRVRNYDESLDVGE